VQNGSSTTYRARLRHSKGWQVIVTIPDVQFDKARGSIKRERKRAQKAISIRVRKAMNGRAEGRGPDFVKFEDIDFTELKCHEEAI